MNWENGWVSEGGDDKPLRVGDEAGDPWLIWLGRPSTGEMVASLYSSVAVDSWWVKGEGRKDLFLSGVVWFWE